ncbi:thiol:disulfide interchange protein [Escherichia coli]|uniref:Thiol:disulfide interchange protein DsbC n=1 Tax=Escherichia coli TaxID=562 RepID=A0A376LAC9_ECOLX|nr:thiol:disulfide interchange protein [Escherichia coli]
MKKGFMLFTLLAAFSGFAQADDAAIQQTLAKMGIKSSDIQPAPVAGMKTVLTNSGVLYITDDGKHIIQGQCMTLVAQLRSMSPIRCC